jgi:hypothetical protein
MLVEELQGVEKHVDNQQFVMDLLVERVDEGEKELANVSGRFQHSKLKLWTLDQKLGNSKVWIDGLVHQIQFITHGSGVFTFPLPIENLLELLEGDSQFVFVTNYPINEFDYVCKNIVVALCGCTYQLFCMAIHLESKAFICVGATCGKPLSTNWLSTTRFHQLYMVLKQPKLETFGPNLTKYAKHDMQPKNTQF